MVEKTQTSELTVLMRFRRLSEPEAEPGPTKIDKTITTVKRGFKTLLPDPTFLGRQTMGADT